jgi:hypothetical protein
MCKVIDSIFENEVVDKVRLSKMVIKNCRFNNTDLVILILQMSALKTAIYLMLK